LTILTRSIGARYDEKRAQRQYTQNQRSTRETKRRDNAPHSSPIAFSFAPTQTYRIVAQVNHVYRGVSRSIERVATPQASQHDNKNRLFLLTGNGLGRDGGNARQDKVLGEAQANFDNFGFFLDWFLGRHVDSNDAKSFFKTKKLRDDRAASALCATCMPHVRCVRAPPPPPTTTTTPLVITRRHHHIAPTTLLATMFSPD
jgi:hypothetical protein